MTHAENFPPTSFGRFKEDRAARRVMLARPSAQRPCVQNLSNDVALHTDAVAGGPQEFTDPRRANAAGAPRGRGL